MEAAREYLRVSMDLSGRLRSVEEQHTENEAAAKDRGWDLLPPYGESTAVSASRFGSTRRGGFEKLLADLESDRFGAGILILWEPKRGSRRVSEWARLIELCDDRGVQVFVTSHRRMYDMQDPRDRRALQLESVDGEYDSAQKSEAIRRAIGANAAAGKPHARTPFGYRRRYEVNSGGKRILVAQEPDAAEAPVVREIFDRLYRGHTLKAICRDFDARGIRTRHGKPWDPSKLRQVALRPIYCGLRVHAPGTRHRDLTGAVEATWPALIDRHIYFAVRSMLMDPARKTTRPGRGIHLLSQIVACDVCGAPLSTTYRYGNGREYQCRAGSHVRVIADDLDQYATAAIFAYLSRDDVLADLRRSMAGQDDQEINEVRGRLAEARAELNELRAAVSAGKLSVGSLVAAEPGILTRIDDLEARERELSTPPALAGLVGDDIRERWDGMPMSAKREVARMLLSPSMLGQLRVGRGRNTGGQMVTSAAERVKWAR
jgi:site-specific DNA recombinase